MKKLQPTTKYRKDLKRYAHNPSKLKALAEILGKLKNEEPIPAKYKPHPLHGNYKGCLECHIEDNFLLIWVDPNTDIIELVRLGTHSELFGK